MPPTNLSSPRKYHESLGPFPKGMNSDPVPLLLEKSQLAWSVNASVRGGFIQPRPAWVKIPLTFSSDEVQGKFEGTLFQGAAYYKPDYGLESLVSQHGGTLFNLVESTDSWSVTDISVPGDPNSNTAPICWMRQAERWLLIDDGTTANIIAYDGSSSRRLNPDTTVLGTLNANFTIPAVGDSAAATLSSDFLGQIGDTILLDGFTYRVVTGAGPSVDNSILTNVLDTAGNSYPAGTQVIVANGLVGVSSQSQNFNAATYVAYPLHLTTNPSVSVGTQVRVGSSDLWTVSGSHTPVNNILFLDGTRSSAGTYPAGTPVYLVSGGSTTILGTLQTAETSPSVGGEISIQLNPAFSGTDGQTVYLGAVGSAQYTIRSIAPATSTTVYLENISATAGGTVNSGENLITIPELPPGRMMAYGMGHVCLCLTDGISFIYGDTVGGPSGSAIYDYRDAVLKASENTFLNNGGTFRIPSSGEFITSMSFPAVLDAALGQGPLQVGTPLSMFSCLVPTDRSVWATLTNPILPQSLVGRGPTAQDSTNSVNSDTFFRSTFGLNSLILARREFNQPTGNWGNTPISTEMIRVLQQDNQALLQFASSTDNDNRYLHLCNPQVHSLGTYHRGIIAMNLDPLSSMQGKAPACYDGLWTGLYILKVVSGMFSNVYRTMAFVINPEGNKIELWELSYTGSSIRSDNNESAIQWAFETPVLFHPEDRTKEDVLLRLNNGQLHLRNIYGTAQITVKYRPSFWPCWVEWFSFDVCSSGNQPGYITPVGLGEPPTKFPDVGTYQQPFRVGRFFQIRVEVTGYCEFMGGDFEAVLEPTVPYAKPECEVKCQNINCDLPDDFGYLVPESVDSVFTNERVYYAFPCEFTIAYSGLLPAWITIDAANQQLVGAGGQYSGSTQAIANAAAQQALNLFAADAIEHDQLVCLPPS